jgi:hypothetical protein
MRQLSCEASTAALMALTLYKEFMAALAWHSACIGRCDSMAMTKPLGPTCFAKGTVIVPM